MSEPSIIHSTFVIERSFPKPPETVFSLFTDPVKKRRWFAEGDNHEVEEFVSESNVGGVERLRYRFKEGTPFAGLQVTNDGRIQEIVQNRSIVTASTMAFGEKRFSASLVTVELLPTETGTDVICTFQGAFFEGADGPQIREMGWMKLFDNLGKALEA